MKPAAFFDFDNTLLAGDSGKIGVKYLFERKEISLFFVLKVIMANELFKRRLITSKQMVGYVMKLYHGRALHEFEEGVVEFYQTLIKPSLSYKMLEKLEYHRNQGHRLVLLSASIRYMLTHVYNDLNFDDLLCTDLEVGSNGLLTGKAQGKICQGQAKAEAAIKLAKEQNIDLKNSYAYGDHHSDISILSLVGNPTAVGPTSKLRQHAKENNWPIISH